MIGNTAAGAASGGAATSVISLSLENKVELLFDLVTAKEINQAQVNAIIEELVSNPEHCEFALRSKRKTGKQETLFMLAVQSPNLVAIEAVKSLVEGIPEIKRQSAIAGLLIATDSDGYNGLWHTLFQRTDNYKSLSQLHAAKLFDPDYKKNAALEAFSIINSQFFYSIGRQVGRRGSVGSDLISAVEDTISKALLSASRSRLLDDCIKLLSIMEISSEIFIGLHKRLSLNDAYIENRIQMLIFNMLIAEDPHLNNPWAQALSLNNIIVLEKLKMFYDSLSPEFKLERGLDEIIKQRLTSVADEQKEGFLRSLGITPTIVHATSTTSAAAGAATGGAGTNTAVTRSATGDAGATHFHPRDMSQGKDPVNPTKTNSTAGAASGSTGGAAATPKSPTASLDEARAKSASSAAQTIFLRAVEIVRNSKQSSSVDLG